MIYTAENYNYTRVKNTKFQPKPRGNQSGRDKLYYKDLICAFDIETTRITEIEQSIMYVWQFAILFPGENNDIDIIMGRTWDEYKLFMQNMYNSLRLDEKLCIWVHNLSYEFQFLAGIYNFDRDQVFAIERRKVLKCTQNEGRIEYRCSYIHSNMSLAEYTHKMGVDHGKIVNEFDYAKKRYPWTELSDREKEYCINDVVGLVEALEKEMEIDGDNLYTIPLTSTGYVRRDAKRAMKKYNYAEFKEMKLTLELWEICRAAFRGGNTHANRFYADRIIKNVNSYDRSSSYPDVICNCKFPMTPFVKIENPSNQKLIDYMIKKEKACIFRIKMHNVKLRNQFWGFPYLSIDKSEKLYNYLGDNGRVLECEYCEVAVTDIDFNILVQEYEFGFECYELYIADYKKLPQPIIDLNIEYYKKKNELKGVEGQEIYYMKAKNKLNSIYGMMAQNPVKQDIIFDGNWHYDEDISNAELLEKYNKKAFLCYQWGVWVTAWARYRLEEGLQIAGEKGVYCDTDSVKYVGNVDWKDYNKNRILDSINNNAVATDKAHKVHYMGVYEFDGHCNEFITMGAKKYAYTDDNNKIHLTVAGVAKKKGAEELGSLTNFKEGFIFVAAGGTESVYNDNPEIITYYIDGHTISITRNVVIRDSTYQLGLTAEYAEIIQRGKNLCEKLSKIY